MNGIARAIVALGAGTMLVTTVVACDGDGMNAQTMTCTVNDKDRSTDSEGKSVYRVYTDQCDVLEVSDTLVSWDSGTRYNKIKVGVTYNFETRGLRRTWASTFPNIIAATNADTGEVLF